MNDTYQNNHHILVPTFTNTKKFSYEQTSIEEEQSTFMEGEMPFRGAKQHQASLEPKFYYLPTDGEDESEDVS
jgi:hypothetical protein